MSQGIVLGHPGPLKARICAPARAAPWDWRLAQIALAIPFPPRSAPWGWPPRHRGPRPPGEGLAGPWAELLARKQLPAPPLRAPH